LTNITTSPRYTLSLHDALPILERLHVSVAEIVVLGVVDWIVRSAQPRRPSGPSTATRSVLSPALSTTWPEKAPAPTVTPCTEPLTRRFPPVTSGASTVPATVRTRWSVVASVGCVNATGMTPPNAHSHGHALESTEMLTMRLG